MAESYGPLGYLGFLPPGEATPAMRAAATRALEIDPDLVEGLTAIAACASFHEWHWRDAERDYRRAIALNPNYTTAYLWYGHMLEIEGRHDESIAARRRALELDPLYLRAGAAMGSSLFTAGRIEDAIARYRSTLELDPQYFFARRELAVIDVVLGNHAEAIAGFEAAGDRGSLGHALGVAGRSIDARRVLEALEQDARQQYVSPVQMALVHLGLGNHDGTLASLEQAFRMRAVDLAVVRVDARFAPIAADPRFTALLERMNLEPARSAGMAPLARSPCASCPRARRGRVGQTSSALSAGVHVSQTRSYGRRSLSAKQISPTTQPV